LQTDAQGKPKRNVGLDAATAAAKAVDGHVLLPAFDKGAAGTDWNDARKERGMDSVRTALAAGMAAGTRIKIARDIEQDRGYGRTVERERARDSRGRGLNGLDR
jgi:phage/plasmid primase-like uncharacterized protein